MKALYFSFILFFCMFFEASCDRIKSNNQDQQPVTIPSNIRKEIDHIFMNGKERVVVYLLSKEDCAECSVSKIALWKNYSFLINSSNIGIVLITNDEMELKDLSRMNYLGVDLYRILDRNSDFFQSDGKVKANIPSTFVLDKEYITLMEGNPIESGASFESFKKIIASD